MKSHFLLCFKHALQDIFALYRARGAANSPAVQCVVTDIAPNDVHLLFVFTPILRVLFVKEKSRMRKRGCRSLSLAHSGNEQVMNIMIWAQFQSAIVVIIVRGIFLSWSHNLWSTIIIYSDRNLLFLNWSKCSSAISEVLSVSNDDPPWSRTCVTQYSSWFRGVFFSRLNFPLIKSENLSFWTHWLYTYPNMNTQVKRAEGRASDRRTREGSEIWWEFHQGLTSKWPQTDNFPGRYHLTRQKPR